MVSWQISSVRTAQLISLYLYYRQFCACL